MPTVCGWSPQLKQDSYAEQKNGEQEKATNEKSFVQQMGSRYLHFGRTTPSRPSHRPAINRPHLDRMVRIQGVHPRSTPEEACLAHVCPPWSLPMPCVLKDGSNIGSYPRRGTRLFCDEERGVFQPHSIGDFKRVGRWEGQFTTLGLEGITKHAGMVCESTHTATLITRYLPTKIKPTYARITSSMLPTISS